MTYRQDPNRQRAQQWHALLNNGYHYAAVDITGKVHAGGHTPNAPAIKRARLFRPDLTIINVDDQI